MDLRTVEALKLTSKGKLFSKDYKNDNDFIWKRPYLFRFCANGPKNPEAVNVLENKTLKTAVKSKLSKEDETSPKNENFNHSINPVNKTNATTCSQENESLPTILEQHSLTDTLLNACNEEIDRRVTVFINKKQKDFEKKDKEMYINSLIYANVSYEKVKHKLLQIEKEEKAFEKAHLEELLDKQKQLKEIHHRHAKLLDKKNTEAKSEILQRETIKKKEQEMLMEKLRKEIEEVAKTGRLLEMLVSQCEHFEKLPPATKNCSHVMRQIIEKISSLSKKQELSYEDVNVGIALSSEAKKIVTIVHGQIAELNKFYAEEKKKLEDEKSKLAEVAPVGNVTADKSLPSQPSETLNLSGTCVRQYTKLFEVFSKYEDACKELIENPQHKDYKFQLMKVISETVNTINGSNPAFVKSILTKLCRLLKGEVVEISGGDQRVSIRNHPSAGPFCLTRLAKKLVEQGGELVSASPGAAYAFALVALVIWIAHPDFGDLFLAHLAFKCPFAIPFFGDKENMSEVEYYKFLGYKVSKDGELEKDNLYLKRMSGFVTLFAAIIVSQPPQTDSFFNKYSSHPFGIKNAWVWLARVLTHPPLPGITATILYCFLNVVGHDMGNYYGQQFWKLLKFIYSVYLPKIMKVTTDKEMATAVKFRIFLENVLKAGRIEKPKGLQ